MKEDTVTTSKEVIRVILIIFIGIIIAAAIVCLVLAISSKLPSFPVSKSDLLNEKEIEKVVILNGEKSITLNSVEIDGKMYRPAIIYSGSDLCITYYIAYSGPNGEIRKQNVRVAPEKVAIFYIKEDVEEN